MSKKHRFMSRPFAALTRQPTGVSGARWPAAAGPNEEQGRKSVVVRQLATSSFLLLVVMPLLLVAMHLLLVAGAGLKIETEAECIIR